MAEKTITTPAGNTYPDKGYQRSFLYEYLPGKNLASVARDYQCTEDDWVKAWGAKPLAGGDVSRKRFGWAGDRQKFAAEKLVVARYDDIPFCPPNLQSLYQDGDKKVVVKGTFRCHKDVLPYFRWAFTRIFEWAATHSPRYELYLIGTYSHRGVNNVATNSLSPHAMGGAIDINATQNGLKSRIWDMPKEIVRIMMEAGFYWGGIFESTGWDAMHFDYRRPTFPPIYTSPQVTVPINLSLGGGTATPAKVYEHIEAADSGAGGYYGLGLHRNLHGGVHLVPSGQATLRTVQAMAPGYIVAARLPRLDPGAATDAVSAARNWTGFVLVRHDLRLRNDKEKPFDKTQGGPFYSLYMHLAPLKTIASSSTGWADLKGEPYFEKVPWFRNLMQRRYGTFTHISSSGKHPVGATYWSAQLYAEQSPPGGSVDVFGEKDTFPIVPVSATGSADWFFKSGPVDFQKVAVAISEGKLVTFNEPFFTVEAGETLGLLAPAPQTAAKSGAGSYSYKDAKGQRRDAKLASRFLHWEVFAPVKDGKSVMADLLACARTIDDLSDLFADQDTIQETTKDNFLEVPELRSKVVPRLLPEEQTKMNAAIDQMERIEKKLDVTVSGCPGAVIGLFADGTTFAPKTKCDAKGDFVDAPFTYPMQLHLEYEHLLSPARLATGDSYPLKVEYLTVSAAPGKGGDKPSETVIGTQTLAIDKAIFTGKSVADPEDKKKGKILKLTLHVPAQADAIRFSFEGDQAFLTDAKLPSKDDGTTLLAQMAKSRLRGTRIRHLSEWTPKSVELFFKKAQELKLLPAGTEPEPYYRVSWWQPEAVGATRALLESGFSRITGQPSQALLRKESEETVKAVGDKATVFGDQLPTDAEVDNLHPVTATWLLSILQYRKLAEIHPAERAVFHQEDTEPKAAGWILDSPDRAPRLGDAAHAIVIDDDFGYDPSIRVTVTADRMGWSLPIADQHGYGENGVIVKPVTVDFWGDWQLFVGSKSAPATVGKATLSLPEPAVRDTDSKDAAAGMHLPRRRGKHVFWNVKLEKGAPVPAQLSGFVGIEVSPDGRAWHEPTINGKPHCVAVTAIGGAPSKRAEIDEQVFQVEDDAIVDLAVDCKDKNPAVTKSFRWDAYRRVYTDLHVAASLADALAQAGCRDSDVRSLDRSGTRCVLQSGNWRHLHDLAWACLDGDRFAQVGIPGEVAPLTKDELVDHPQGPGSHRMSTMSRMGISLTVKSPLGKLGDCKQLVVGDIAPAGDDHFIGGMRGKATALTKDKSLTSAAFLRKAPMRLSVRLAEGLEELRAASGKAVTLSHLSWDGDWCEVTDTGLVGKALEVASFASAEVVGEGKDKRLRITAPSVHGMTLSFDPTYLLAAVRADQMKSGALMTDAATLQYRYYFCAVNGFGLRVAAEKFELGGGLHEGFLGVTAREAPQVAQARCLSSCGTLRRMGLGKIEAVAVEKDLQITVPLLGNRDAWRDGSAEIKIQGVGPKAKPAKTTKVPIPEGATVLTALVPRPAEHAMTIEVKGMDANGDEASQSATIDLKPELKSGPHATAVDTYVVIWCTVGGVVAPRSAEGCIRMVKDQLAAMQVAAPQARGKRAHEFTLSVKSPTAKKPVKVEYCLPVKQGGGYATKGGIFAARVPGAALDTHVGYALTLTAKCPGESVSLESGGHLRFVDGAWKYEAVASGIPPLLARDPISPLLPR